MIVNFGFSLISRKLGIVVNLTLFVPTIAVACGWLQLLGLILIIGWIVLLVFLVQDGKPNRYQATALALFSQ